MSALGYQSGGSHYKYMPVQPLEVMRTTFTEAEYRGYLKGNIIKYSMRAGRKPGVPAESDAAKMAHYADLLAEFNRDCQRR